MMGKKIFIVDAFADAPFSGNPAAVCLLDDMQDDEWLRKVAAEMNLSETAFVAAQANQTWSLRWFTPKIEVNLCGHATLAAAHVLWREIGLAPDPIRFDTRSGRLTAVPEEDRIVLDFPSDPPAPRTMPDDLIDIIGAEIESFHGGREMLLAVLRDEPTLRGLQPDLTRLADLDGLGLIVTAAGENADYDFVSRFFAPGAGIPEDPVTGSAHCVLGPYWGRRLGRSSLHACQASQRGGVVDVALQGERVALKGRAFTVLRGELCV